MSRTARRTWAALAAAAVALSFAPAALASPAALAAPDACSARVNDTHAKLAECITLAGVREHQAALQKVADANHGTRVSGSPGYDASVDYVVQRLRAAGYTPPTSGRSPSTPSSRWPRRSSSACHPPRPAR